MMGPVSDTTPLRVVVAGSGIAGVEALLGLHELAGDRIDVTLLSPDDHFVYRPFAVAEPFGLGHAERIPLKQIAADAGARWTRGALASVDDRGRVARTAEGEAIEYDALLVAVGALPVEGVARARTWWPGGDPEILGGLLRDLEEGYVKSVAFVVPSGFVWPLPVYELALMTAHDARGMGADDVTVTVVTPEARPLAVFGDRASAALGEELERAGVRLVAGTVADPRPAAGGTEVARPDGGEPIVAQRTVAIPRVLGPALEGLPSDDEGFVLVDDDGRVRGHERTWAAGDGIASDVKLGGLATWQARRAAAAIARLAGASAPPPDPDETLLEGVLMTGAAPRRLDDKEGGRPEHLPLWRPVGKVAGRWLPRYLGDELVPPAEEAPPPAPEAVRVERRVSDLESVDGSLFYDRSKPLHPNSPEVRRLGRRMHGDN
jgi:sulfide:quinone oxidoreductase